MAEDRRDDGDVGSAVPQLPWKKLAASFYAVACLCSVACGPPKQAPPEYTVMKEDRRAPPKPGESITHTQMCSCLVCEPVSCCREMEAEQPEMDEGCADGYDFSSCEMAVSSCESNCFHHRWRTRVEVGCSDSRPDKCCHAQSAF